MAAVLFRGTRLLFGTSVPPKTRHVISSALPSAAAKVQGCLKEGKKGPSPGLKTFLWNQRRSAPAHATIAQLRCLSDQKQTSDEIKKKSPPLTIRFLSLTPHENVYTLPNFLTLSRLIAAPIVGYLVLHDQHLWALGLFAYAGITDLVDGYVARRWKLQTVVGTVIDPMADKTLMTVLVGCLAWKGALPLWLAAIILSRDFLLGLAAIYYRYISLPAPKTFARYWDFSLPSAEVHPTGISKVNTALQLGLIGSTVAMPLMGPMEWVGTGMTGFQYLVAATTVWSGASYVYTKDAVKILSQGGKG